MDVNLLGLEIMRFESPSNPEVCKAHFFSKGVKLANPPRVCCKRYPVPVPPSLPLLPGTIDMTCFPTIDNLQSHNSHVPVFKSQAEREIWIERIQLDVEKAADGYDGEITSKPTS
jgi:hypothetical protein